MSTEETMLKVTWTLSCHHNWDMPCSYCRVCVDSMSDRVQMRAKWEEIKNEKKIQCELNTQLASSSTIFQIRCVFIGPKFSTHVNFFQAQLPNVTREALREKCKTVEIQLIRSWMQCAHRKRKLNGVQERRKQELAMYQFIATLYESHDNFKKRIR